MGLEGPAGTYRKGSSWASCARLKRIETYTARVAARICRRVHSDDGRARLEGGCTGG